MPERREGLAWVYLKSFPNYPNKQPSLKMTALQHFSNFIVHTSLLGAFPKIAAAD